MRWRTPRLGTGMKMLLILTAALLPLGLIAVFASIETMQGNQLRRDAEARQLASQSARQVSAVVARLALDLREAAATLTDTQVADFAQRCTATLDRLALAERFDVRLALFTQRGAKLCATPGFSDAPARPPAMVFATEVRLLQRAGVLRFEGRNAGSPVFAIGELPAASIADIARPSTIPDNSTIELVAGGERLSIIRPDASARQGRIVVASPVAGGQVALLFGLQATAITIVDLLMTLLPLLMWIAAALIGWLVVDRLLVRPLLQMQRAIDGYQPGTPLVLPVLKTPAHELRALGEAFLNVTRTIEAHERDLEAGLARQTKLTREVHHRVKNNLQVVSSLINIHSRAATEPAVALAYASILRRVDALAVVHRNHFAELEVNHGVNLRTLIGELAANLRASAPKEAGRFAITIDVVAVSVHQDVALPIAFLVTELVELAMSREPRGLMAISLCYGEAAGKACLTVASDALVPSDDAGVSLERTGRVITGLARQLRAPLQFDAQRGAYTIEISYLPPATAEEMAGA